MNTTGRNKLELISTEYYSLSEFFYTPNRKIIIPDFQRDYCWGDGSHGEHKANIVLSFLETLKDEYENYKRDKNGDTILGKIDVYQNPHNHIYLTDGQQRITTLYLLLGMLYKKTRNQRLRHCLISEYEENHDDKEPYLQYAIRENSIFFLRDLVNNFFIGEKNLKVADINIQLWFFNEYNLDPTINSILHALNIIEKKLKEIEDFELYKFSDFIIYNVKIQYYDVVDRKSGEERFVIINTTGKSLTESENIKPLLLGKLDAEQYRQQWEQWEDRETWFWQNRNKAKEEIADGGVNDFLIWGFQIIENQESIDLIKESKKLFKSENAEKVIFDRLLWLNKCFNSLKTLINLLESNLGIQTQFSFINGERRISGIIDLRGLSRESPNERQQNVLLPLLAFIGKISNNERDIYQFLRRLKKNYFDKIWERNDNYIDWRYILQIIEKSQTIDACLKYEILEKLDSLELPKKKWYNDEEKWKDELKKEHQNIIECWEDHADFMGDLSPLFKVTVASTDINKLKDYYNSYCDFINPQGEELKNEIALLRICTDFIPRWFTNADDGGFRGIEQNLNCKIFNIQWFFKIWHIFTKNEAQRLVNLKKINKIILSFMLEKKRFEENEVFNNLDFSDVQNITIEKIKEFEKIRTRDWMWSGDFIVASIYYWMYLEKLYCREQQLSIIRHWNQIGLNIFDEAETEESTKYSYANLTVTTHYPSSKSLNYKNYKLMNDIDIIRRDENLDKEVKRGKVKEIFNRLHNILVIDHC